MSVGLHEVFCGPTLRLSDMKKGFVLGGSCSCPEGSVSLKNKCRECQNEYARDYQRQRYEQRKIEALSLLGGVCVDCGSDEDLQFDHVDPKTKFTEVSMMLSKYSWKRIKQELDKCVLRCPPCHSAKSNANGDNHTVEHGGGLSGKKNCPCPPCKDKKAEYMRSYNAEAIHAHPASSMNKRAPFRDVYIDIARKERELEKASFVPEGTVCKCGKTKTKRSQLCWECDALARRVAVKEYPELNVLVSMVRSSGFSAVGRELGMSDNAVRKHLKKNGVDPATIKKSRNACVL